ncbi:hypothetical protein Ngar_c29590 [Candidatus Nitrososphaera gargensis Ga9.2]|uniref:Uncharacterized protein n=1 Tax=Nitrososphaera gargensis (strain Ga9.2) TaxID=1237085 RepID=K0IM13_NITGG|nr:hypothetical protein Ngar_c29590 [Candidatus Nitrososphaera gargensis Ga9.2]
MLLTREYSRKAGSKAGDKKQAGIYAAGSQAVVQLQPHLTNAECMCV